MLKPMQGDNINLAHELKNHTLGPISIKLWNLRATLQTTISPQASCRSKQLPPMHGCHFCEASLGDRNSMFITHRSTNSAYLAVSSL